MHDDKPDYDNIPCPGIGEFTPRKPEVWEFTAEGDKYRAVLIGKNGYRGYKEAPVVRIEHQYGVDALGVEKWNSCGDEIDIPAVSQLLLTVRDGRK